MKYVVMCRSDITVGHIALSRNKKETIRHLPNGQSILRLKNEYDDIFAGYIKYTSEELNELISSLYNEDGSFINKKIPSKTSESLDSGGMTVVAVSKPSGNFDTVITHNFCDNTSWEVSALDSTWQLRPESGKIYRIFKAELQFEHDISLLLHEMYIDYYVWHTASPGTPILGKRIEIDSVRKIFELGNEHYHCPALPEIPTGLSTVIFNYANRLGLYGDETPGELAYIEISTKDHAEPVGSYATVGFVVEEESV